MIVKSSKGFSFPELLIAVSVLSIIIVGMIDMFVSASVLGELAGNSALAIDQAQSVIEEIRQTDYATIVTNYGVGGTPGNTFTLTNPIGKGVITLNDTGDLLTVTVTVCYKNKYNRITGEDTNLNGELDPGEDANSNGVIDSPVYITTMMAKRQ